MPDRNRVASDARAWTANIEFDDASEASRIVWTLGKVVELSAMGETKKIDGEKIAKMHVENVREFLSSEKNSVKRSSEANLNSFRFNFLPRAPDEVSVLSLTITTIGIVVADFAVLGLNTSVFISSNDLGAEDSEANACLQVSGESVLVWDTEAAGLMDKAAKVWVMDSRDAMEADAK